MNTQNKYTNYIVIVAMTTKDKPCVVTTTHNTATLAIEQVDFWLKYRESNSVAIKGCYPIASINEVGFECLTKDNLSALAKTEMTEQIKSLQNKINTL